MSKVRSNHFPGIRVGDLREPVRGGGRRGVNGRLISVSTIEDEIFQLEGVQVVFDKIVEGFPVHYPYINALSSNYCADTFHKRIAKFTKEPYYILDGYRHRVLDRNMTMSAIRASYERARPRVSLD